MDTLIANLLSQGDFKSIGDKFYLPNSSKRPSRQFSESSSLSTGDFARLPGSFDSLCKKFTEAARLLKRIEDSDSWTVSNLQPILNSCREFFNESIEYFGLESTSLQQGEWILRAATCNYIFVGLLISRAGELEVDGEERIGEVFHSIKKCLASMNKKDETKRPMVIFLFAECFRLMFKLKRLGLFPSLLTSVQVLGAEKLLQRARKSDSTQFLFYRALYEFHGQKFKEAWQRFKDTWALLHVEDWIHRRRVAVYLIALAMCHGMAPAPAFLQKYSLQDDLGELTRCLKQGNAVAFQQELNSRAPVLHRVNIYVFLLLNSEAALHLNLIKRTWRLAGKPRILTFQQIFLVAGERHQFASFDELECVLINLIGKGWIRGHLGHDSQAIVLSSADPFPSVLQL